MAARKDSSTGRRLGLQPCPLCRNVEAHRPSCKACKGAGMVTVDVAVQIALTTSDTEREMLAVKKP